MIRNYSTSLNHGRTASSKRDRRRFPRSLLPAFRVNEVVVKVINVTWIILVTWSFFRCREHNAVSLNLLSAVNVVRSLTLLTA